MSEAESRELSTDVAETAEALTRRRLNAAIDRAEGRTPAPKADDSLSLEEASRIHAERHAERNARRSAELNAYEKAAGITREHDTRSEMEVLTDSVEQAGVRRWCTASAPRH